MPFLAEGVSPEAITPDGQNVLGIDPDGAWHWYPVNGGAPRLAPGLTSRDRPNLGWSEDGKSIYVRISNEVPAPLERLDIATGRRTPLREIGPADRAGLFSLSVASVSHDGAQYAYRYQKRLSTLFIVTGGK